MLLITKHEYQRKQRKKAVFKEGGFLFVLSGLFLFILICPLIRKRGKQIFNTGAAAAAAAATAAAAAQGH